MAKRTNGLFTETAPGFHHAKGSCYVYGTADVGVDMGVIIEGEGVLFLSRLAIVEAAQTLGLVYAEDSQAIEEENAHLQHEIGKLRERLELAEDALLAGAQAAARALEGDTEPEPEEEPDGD